MPEASTSHTTSVQGNQATVWEALQDPRTWQSIGPIDAVSNPRYRSDRSLAGFDWTTNLGGKRYVGTATLTVCEPTSKYGLRLDTSEVSGDILTVITESGDVVEVSVTLAFRTKGMLSALFFPAIKQALATGFPEQVEAFAATF